MSGPHTLDALDLAPPAGMAVLPRRWRPVPTAAMLFLLHGLLALLSLYVSRQPGSIATIWYANAAAVMVVLFAPAAWRWGLWAVVGLANVAVNLLWSGDWGLALGFLPANLFEMVLAEALLRRAGLAQQVLAGPGALLRLWGLGGLIPQVLAATLGAITLQARGVATPFEVWLTWVEGSVIGAISVLPLAHALLSQPWAASRRALGDWRTLALAPTVVGVTLLALGHAPFPFVYIVLPLLLSAMVLDVVAVALLTLLTSACIALALALGIFVPPPVRMAWEQGFVYLAAAAALMPAPLLAVTTAALREGRQRLARRTRELQQANERLEQFVRIASHDLREPLNTVAQFGRLIEADHAADLPASGRQYLTLMIKASDRMRRLLDDVLQFTRLQAGDDRPMQPVVLDEVLEDLRHALAARLQDSGGSLHVAPLPVVPGHAVLLSLLFQNLLANALKFVPEGRVPEVRVWAEADGPDGCVVHVADNGIGIEPQDLPRLFRPFERLHLRRHFEGSGLGLALCREVAQRHGGHISVDSTPGQGSCFHVHLPGTAPAAR